MIRLNSILIGLNLICSSVDAQNLVPNPSFETFSSCPTNYGQLTLAIPWIAPTNDNSDLFNVCGSTIVGVPYHHGPYGFQYPSSGNGYAGFWAYNGINNNYREYLQVQLFDTLVSGKCYFIEFHTNLENGGINYAVNNIGINFSDTSTLSTGTGYILNLTPNILKFNNPIIDDTLNWTKVTGIYFANGGEAFITIGNFFNDANTDTLNTGNGWYQGAYYYIDDVSVIPIDSILVGMPAFAGNDTIILGGDSVFIGQEVTNLNCNWYIGTTLIADSVSGLYVGPVTTTTYTVEQNLCGAITFDTITVFVSGVGINENDKEIQINLYPNPTKDDLHISVNDKDIRSVFVEITDITGKVVYSSEISIDEMVSKLNLNIDNGIYLVKITDKNTQKIATQKIVINK